MNLAVYLRLLDWSSRLLCRGMARVLKDLADILQRPAACPGMSAFRGKLLATKFENSDRRESIERVRTACV